MNLIKFIIVLIIAIISTETAEAGISSRIIGGSSAYPGQFPYSISLQTPGYGHFCGGAILNTRWVLTTGSCVINKPNNQILIRVGSIYHNNSGVLHGIVQKRIHQLFNETLRSNDIATLQTQTNIQFNGVTQPISLPRYNYGVANSLASIVTGWGHTQFPQTAATTYSQALQFLNTATILTNDCRYRHANTNLKTLIQENNICSFATAGRGICTGDIGSPLAIGNEIVGLVSMAIPCAQGLPDINTRVFAHKSWILQNVV